MKLRDSTDNTLNKYHLRSKRHNRARHPLVNYAIDPDCKDDVFSKKLLSDISLVESKLHLKAKANIDLKVILDDTIIGYLPKQLNEIFNAITESKYILKLEDDWDDDGAKSYKAATWTKAIIFLINYSNWTFNKLNKKLSTPRILQGPNGSIDIYWKNSNFLFLMNIPEEGDATYYGEDYKKNKCEGAFDPSDQIFKIFPIIIEI